MTTPDKPQFTHEAFEKEWRPIPGFSGYEVSDQGRVRYTLRWKSPHLLRLAKHSRGYLKAFLTVDKKMKTMFVHRLVAMAFLPNPDGLPYINHLNAVKTDNRPSNLEWASHASNTAHAVKNGLIPVGATHGNTKLSDEQVMQIHVLHASGRNKKSLAREFKVDPSNVRAILNGTSRKPVFNSYQERKHG